MSLTNTDIERLQTARKHIEKVKSSYYGKDVTDDERAIMKALDIADQMCLSSIMGLDNMSDAIGSTANFLAKTHFPAFADYRGGNIDEFKNAKEGGAK